MNGSLAIIRNHCEINGRCVTRAEYALDNGARSGRFAVSDNTVMAIEEGLKIVISDLTRTDRSGIDLTVKLPEGITLTDAYKTQVTTKFTGDGTIASITFE